METNIVYFETGGKINTDTVLKLAAKRAGELGIKTIVIASTSGDTAVKAVTALEGLKVIVVSTVIGNHEANVSRFTETNKAVVENKGCKIVTAAHAFTGINGALQAAAAPQFQPAAGGLPTSGPPPRAISSTGDIIASTLRIMGHGTKVACEIAAMAADAGLVKSGEEIISVAGSRSGSDTAVVLVPANTHRFFDTKIKEIICKPR